MDLFFLISCISGDSTNVTVIFVKDFRFNSSLLCEAITDPSLIIVTRSQVFWISNKSWEDSKIVVPECFSSSKSLRNSLWRFGSKPPGGSSRINNFGLS